MSASDSAALVKQSVDIVDVVSQVVPLRRVGNRHLGLCPFHQEKTPSFQVDAEAQLYYCFGCGSGGDVLSFVMKHRNVSFGEALEYLADRYHIVLPRREDGYESGPSGEAVRRERDELYGVLRAAGEFFYSQLHHSEAGKPARAYLLQRGLPASVVEEERLGFAPPRWDGLLQHLKHLGVSPELGLTAGLLARSSKDESRLYDRFRNRLIFPIVNEQKRIVAFGGRSLPGDSQDEPKYLNSPETPVYQKGRMLYQMARAREACRQTRHVLLVEGYLDLLAFHVHGFHRVVATLGTALTSQQVRLLLRIADEVTLAYDGDQAGERAMLRALPLFLAGELPVSCILFPDGMDPDDFLKNRGIQALEKLLAERRDLGTVAVEKELDTWDGSIMGKTKVLSRLKPLLDSVRQPVVRAEYVRMAAERLSVPREVMEEQLGRGGSRPDARRERRPADRGVLPDPDRSWSIEESILKVMIQYPELIEEVVRAGAVEHFLDSSLKAIAQTIVQVPYPPLGVFDPAAVYDLLPESPHKEVFARLKLDLMELEQPRLQMEDWLGALFERAIKHRRLHLGESLRQAEREGNHARVRHFLTELQNLSSTRKKVRVTHENV